MVLVLSGEPDNLELGRAIDRGQELLHAREYRIFDLVLNAVLALQNWKFFQDYDCSLVYLERQTSLDQNQSRAAVHALHQGFLLVFRSGIH